MAGTSKRRTRKKQYYMYCHVPNKQGLVYEGRAPAGVRPIPPIGSKRKKKRRR